MQNTSPVFYTRAGLHTEIYDIQTRAGWESLHDDVSFYLDEARRSDGPVMEIACGSGRVLLPLLKSLDRQFHGLDKNEAMLNTLKQKASHLSPHESERLHLHRAGMENFEIVERFGLVVIAFRSFQVLLTPEAQLRCLRCIHRHLSPGGRLIINLFDPRYDLMLPGRQPGNQPVREIVHPVTGNTVRIEVLERTNDPLAQTFKEDWRFTEHDVSGEVLRREEEHFELRWTFRYEFRHLAERAGFSVKAEYSDFNRSEPAYAKEQVWILRKS